MYPEHTYFLFFHPHTIQLIPRSFIHCRAKRKSILEIGSRSDWRIFDGIMDADLFCNVLETTLVPFIRNKLPDHRFMQDNDPKHMSRRAQAFFEKESINWWRTPPDCPDLNPIKDLWHELKFYLETKVKPRNKQDLVDGIKKFWERKVMPEKCAKLLITFCTRLFQLWWSPEVLQPSIEKTALVGATAPCCVEC